MDLPITTSATNSVINLITVTSFIAGIGVILSHRRKLKKQKKAEKQRKIIEKKTKQALEIET